MKDVWRKRVTRHFHKNPLQSIFMSNGKEIHFGYYYKTWVNGYLTKITRQKPNVQEI